MTIRYKVGGIWLDPNGKPVEGAESSEPPSTEGFDPANVTDDQLSRLTKPRLVAVAEVRGVELPDGATNAQIIAALTDRQGE